MTFPFFKREKKAADWNDLSMQQKKNVTAKIISVAKNLAGPKYKIVQGPDQFLREQGMVETKPEDQILTAYRRGRMLDLARNAARNSSTFNAILKQFDLNCVGNGGKAILNFDDIEQAMYLKKEFAKWTREADFFDGLNFNTLLKLILKTYLIGGDMVILFDDGLVEDSGKLLVYEPDEIGETTADALAKHFGKGARQSQGRVYNANGRFIGCIVSRSQRGFSVFDPEKSYFLKRDPNVSMFEQFWLMPRNVFRVAQGRGVSPMSSSIGTITDLEDLCQYELQSAKKNSQVLAQVLQEDQQQEDAVVPSAFDNETDFESMSDSEIEEAVSAESSEEQVVTLDKVAAAGCIYQSMPQGYKLELLDTKHPNDKMPEFISWLAGRAAAPFGLSEQFATLQVDGASYRANQLFSKRAFEDGQKFLEQICDWTFYKWLNWSTKKSIVTKFDYDEDIIHQVDWAWPRVEELDENAHADAVQKKLANMTLSYKEELGSDWKEKLMQIKHEIDWMKENNLAHPSYQMISGGERTGADEDDNSSSEDSTSDSNSDSSSEE